jgi:hypothetical protein
LGQAGWSAFLVPLAGIAIGASAGAEVGLAGSLGDYGIRDDFARKFAETIPQGSALFVPFKSECEDEIPPEIEPYEPHHQNVAHQRKSERRPKSELSNLSDGPICYSDERSRYLAAYRWKAAKSFSLMTVVAAVGSMLPAASGAMSMTAAKPAKARFLAAARQLCCGAHRADGDRQHYIPAKINPPACSVRYCQRWGDRYEL